MIPLSAQIAWFDRHSHEIPELLRGYLTDAVLREAVELEHERLASPMAFEKYGDNAFWLPKKQLVGYGGEAPMEIADASFYVAVARWGDELTDEYEDTITHRIVAPPIEEVADGAPDD